MSSLPMLRLRSRTPLTLTETQKRVFRNFLPGQFHSLLKKLLGHEYDGNLFVRTHLKKAGLGAQYTPDSVVLEAIFTTNVAHISSKHYFVKAYQHHTKLLNNNNNNNNKK